MKTIINHEKTQMKNVILIGDFRTDPTGECALVLSKYEVMQQRLNLLGVVSAVTPSIKRARVAKGTLNSLGLRDVWVASCVSLDLYHGDSSEFEIEYLAREEEVFMFPEPPLHALFKQADDNSIDLVVWEGFDTAYDFVKEYTNLFLKKIRSVTVLGETGGETLAPKHMKFNGFGPPPAPLFFQFLESNEIKTTVVTQHAVDAFVCDPRIYQKMARTGNPIGYSLREFYYRYINKLYRDADKPKGARNGLPGQYGREWFVNKFLNHPLRVPHITNIAPTVTKTYMPSPLLLLALTHPERFSHTAVGSFSIIGLSEENHGIKDPAATADYLSKYLIEALFA